MPETVPGSPSLSFMSVHCRISWRMLLERDLAPPQRPISREVRHECRPARQFCRRSGPRPRSAAGPSPACARTRSRCTHTAGKPPGARLRAPPPRRDATLPAGGAVLPRFRRTPGRTGHVVARHPSEPEERKMMRLLAFALHAQAALPASLARA
ncbi:MAG: YaeQ family protein [Pseudomonadales bacterium]|nr:YaeQ family protein [Pseudomonadales bacterium]